MFQLHQKGHAVTVPQLPIHKLPDVFHTEPQQARASLDILAGYPTQTILPGQGKAQQGAIAAAVALAKK